MLAPYSTDMWNGFTHMKDRYTKRKRPVTLAVNACLMAEAFGVGEMKMAEMSDLNFNLLRSTREDFIRVDTLCVVNDIVSNFIHALPIFKQWNLLDNKLLADADGQKHATSERTIQSRYSKKYLGKGRGISLYTLIANFVAVNARNIGLNEYEGHALYDMIYGNKTDIDIDMVTGDNHSLNQLNFIALDAIDVEYVPSIKNVRETANDLYSIKSPDAYTGILQPKGKINVDRIKSQKRGILRVLLSLIMQENTQSNIIRKLNSHSRYVRLKAGLFEYNKIFKSTHILNMINDMQLEIGKVSKTIFLCLYLMREKLRVEIHEAQNVVERLNSIMRFIFYGKLGEISTNVKEYQELGIVCLHLLQACMAYINTLIFQKVLSRPEWQNLLTLEDKRALNVLFHSHINPYGLFPLDLSKRLGIMAETLETGGLIKSETTPEDAVVRQDE